MTTLTYKTTPLYGGALTALLPTTFIDASTLRDVPSHQEVYLSRTTLTSIIIELVERAAPPTHPCSTDAAALRYHYSDIASAQTARDEDETTRMHVPPHTITPPAALPERPAWRMVGSQHPARQREGEAAFTTVVLSMVRLVEQETDLLVAVNVPHKEGEFDEGDVGEREEKGGKGRLVRVGVEMAEKVVGSLEVVDWGLFGSGDGDEEGDEEGEGV